MILHITDAKHHRDYQLWLKFNNGSEGMVDLAHALWEDMFEPLEDPALFRKIKLDEELGTVVWPNGADLAPEFLYDLLQQGRQV